MEKQSALDPELPEKAPTAASISLPEGSSRVKLRIEVAAGGAVGSGAGSVFTWTDSFLSGRMSCWVGKPGDISREARR